MCPGTGTISLARNAARLERRQITSLATAAPAHGWRSCTTARRGSILAPRTYSERRKRVSATTMVLTWAAGRPPCETTGRYQPHWKPTTPTRASFVREGPPPPPEADSFRCGVRTSSRHGSPTGPPTDSPRLSDRVRNASRLRHLSASARTEEAYLQWIRRYFVFHGCRDPAGPGAEHVTAFLNDLVTRRVFPVRPRTRPLQPSSSSTVKSSVATCRGSTIWFAPAAPSEFLLSSRARRSELCSRAWKARHA